MNKPQTNNPAQTVTKLTVGLTPIPTSPLQAITAKCRDCCGYVRSEVEKCTARRCPIWPFRMGNNPYRAPRSKKQQRAAERSGERLAALARSKKPSCPPALEQPKPTEPAESSDLASTERSLL
jgi:hypothetical protein